MVAVARPSPLVGYSFTNRIHSFVMCEASVHALDAYSEILGSILQSNPDVPVRILYDNTRCAIPPLRYTFDQLVSRRLSIGAPLPLRMAYLVSNGLARDTLMELVDRTRRMDVPTTRRQFFLSGQRDEAIRWLLDDD